MINPCRQALIEKLEILDKISVWNSHIQIALRHQRDERAIDLLESIIEAIEDPKLLETLKHLKEDASIPF